MTKLTLTDIPQMDDSNLTAPSSDEDRRCEEERAIAVIASSLCSEENANNHVNNEEIRVIEFKSYGNNNAVDGIEVKLYREVGTIEWRGNVYKINERLIRVRKERDEHYRLVDVCDVISVDETINLILATLDSKRAYPNKAIKFLNELVGTVFRSDWEIDDNDVTNYNLSSIQPETEFTVDVQQVLRDNAVVCFHVNQKGLMLSGKRYSWIKGCLEAATEQWGFALPDKTNSKRAIAGDAVIASGRSADGSLSIVKDDKATKQLNREAMIKHISAEVPEVYEDGHLSQLSSGKFAVSYGFGAMSLLINDPLLSASSGDAEIINRDAISFTVNKLMSQSVNIDLLFVNNDEYKAQVEKRAALQAGDAARSRKQQVDIVMADIKAHLNARMIVNPVVAPNEPIVFNGQVIFINNQAFEVSLYSANVRPGVFLNTECRTVDVNVHCKAAFSDYNVKLRGQWVKGMTAKVESYQVEGAEEAQLILNHNSIKNEKAVALRAWANANGQRIAWTAEGELRYVSDEWQLGDVVDLKAVEAELAAMTNTYQVTNVISKMDYETFKNANPEAFSNVDADINGEIVTLTYEAEGLLVPMIYAIELSSVQENLSLNRRVSPDRASFLTTFNVGDASDRLAAHMDKITRTMKEAGNKVNPEVFNVNNAEDKAKLVELLTNRVNLPTRDLFKALGQVCSNGIKLVAQTKDGRRACEAVINTNLLGKLGAFRNDGYSYNAQIKEVHALLALITCPQVELELIVEYVMALGKALEGWKRDITSQDKAFTKGNPVFNTHGMKVLSASVVKDAEGNYLPSYETISVGDKTQTVPVIWINSENPLAVKGTKDKLGNKVKPVRPGDSVLGYRNPMIDLTPMIVRFNDEVCDKFTCAVSPSVLAWSSQTDNDGDVFWAIPATQFRVGNIDGNDECAIANREALVKMFQHPLVGKDIAVKTMAAFERDDLFGDIIKSRSNFGLGVSNVIGESMANIVDLAEKVALHYKKRIGQGYAMMFNAYNSFVRKYNKVGFEGFSEAELIAIKACSFVFYEDAGLAGYSDDNEAVFAKIDNLAKQHLGKVKAKSNGMFGKKAGGNKDHWYYASLFRAQGMVQSEVERKELKVDSSNSAIKETIEEAVNNGLFRTLTKGHLAYQSDDVSGIFGTNFVVDEAHPYAPAMKVWKSFVKGGLVH